MFWRLWHPSRARLERFVAGRDAGARLARHVERCERCRATVGEIRQDAEMLACLRQAAETESEAHRSRILDICRKAESDVPKRP